MLNNLIRLAFYKLNLGLRIREYVWETLDFLKIK